MRIRVWAPRKVLAICLGLGIGMAGLPSVGIAKPTMKGGNRKAEEQPAEAPAPAPAPAQESRSTLGEVAPSSGDNPYRIVEENDGAARPAAKPTPAGAPVEAPSPVDGVKGPAATATWYGHAFVYVTSSTGVRIAIDPFGKGAVGYAFPPRLPADLVLVSNEADDHSAAERLFGTPQVFRSITAVGLNRANGLLFKGVEVYRERRRSGGAGKATAFLFEVDGVSFAHLGAIGDTPDFNQRNALGKADVVFLGIGEDTLPVKDLVKMATDMGAKVIVPVKYKTEMTGGLRLRGLQEFLDECELPVRRLESHLFRVNGDSLPSKPEVWVPAMPPVQAQEM